MTYNEYVTFYGLGRSEGLVLRALADAYKALRRSVPEAARTEEVEDLTQFLGELVRQVDSSLLDEWAALTTGDGGVAPEPVPVVTRNVRAFRIQVRNALWRRVSALALNRTDLLRELDGHVDWDAARTAYLEDHEAFQTGPDARGPQFLQVTEHADRWEVLQVLDDPDGDRDWALHAEVDLTASDDAGEAVVRVLAMAPVGPGWMSS